jgi:hypothetical protein
MSKIALVGDASGTGTLSIVAPNTNTDYTLTLPAEAGTVLTSGGAIDVNASAPADSVVISSTGNVGIGTSSTGMNSAGLPLVVGSGSGNTGMTIYSGNASGGSIHFADTVTTGADSYRGFINYIHSSNSMQFGTNATERMRIDTSGNLLVGKTGAGATTVGGEVNPSGRIGSTLAASTNGAGTTLDVYSTGASAYRFYVGMGGTVFATSTTISAISDQRFKQNIRDLDVGLAEIMQLQPRVFDWKEGKGKGTQNDRGFVAQEFEQVFPDLIDEWKDPAPEGEEPYKSVRQDLIPVLVKAIQELKAELDTVKAEVEALKGQA